MLNIGVEIVVEVEIQVVIGVERGVVAIVGVKGGEWAFGARLSTLERRNEGCRLPGEEGFGSGEDERSGARSRTSDKGNDWPLMVVVVELEIGGGDASGAGEVAESRDCDAFDDEESSPRPLLPKV